MNLDIKHFILNEEATVSEALKLIDANAQGICFIIDREDKPVGILTDGDIRRAFLKEFNLKSPVAAVMNKSFTVYSIDAHSDEINAALNQKIRHIPLIDGNGKLVDYASRTRTRRIPIMQPTLAGNELQYVTDCIQTGWISSQGSYVKQFEKMFAEYCQVPYALAASNGTTALHLALASLHIGPGDEVIVPDFTFAASINSILYTGATPVIVDVNIETWTIDINSLKDAITPRTKAIMPVHIYGHACDMDAIMKIAEEHKLYVVEDCAEALGSTYHNKRVGSFGEIGTFSFFGNKTITTGEGGMLVFKDKATYELAAVLRDHGMSKQKRYWHDMIGFNYRMTNLQAAIGVAQMERIDEITGKKRQVAKDYDRLLKNYKGLQLHGEKEGTINSYWLYTLLVKPESGFTRDELATRLAKNGIETRPAFFPMHAMPVYAAYKGDRSFSNSIYISEHGLSLPSYADITEEELENVVKAIDKAYSVKSFNHTQV